MAFKKRDIARLAPYSAMAGVSLFAAFLLRFEFAVPQSERQLLVAALCFYVPLKGLVFYGFGVQRISSRIAGVFDLARVAIANATACAITCVVALAIFGPVYPRSIYVIDGLICFVLTSGFQFGFRMAAELACSRSPKSGYAKNVLVYGAGAAGLTLAREVRSNPRLDKRIVGFLDDDLRRLGTSILGVPVVGIGRDAARIVAGAKRRNDPVSEIIIAMPSANGKEMRSAIANCRAAGVRFKTVPSLGELLSGQVLSSQIREVNVNDLLGREPVSIDESAIRAAIRGRSVMVTGGCGSIGSELCRQLGRFEPARLVVFDQAESDLFMLMLDLRKRFPGLDIVPELGDITRPRRIAEAMVNHSIEAVFHAAAYKHVPMMEANLLEAVENNVIGTYNVAKAAYDAGVGRFVMISSDKAVNPSSMMGVTKRVAELLVSAMPLDGRQRVDGSFVSVRFGNVLASAGSVVQIFQRQIAAGGPVTVTDPQMRRYFMSIPEAVQLVLQASAMGHGSEVFVLDMGEPVRIVDLAHNMIRLAGLVPDQDIAVEFTGLRPGEKLFEELRIDGEDIAPTFHEKINIFRSGPPDSGRLAQWLDRMFELLAQGDRERVKAHLIELVPSYQGSVAQYRETPARAGRSAVRAAS